MPRGGLILASIPPLAVFLYLLTPLGLVVSHHALIVGLPTLQYLLFAAFSQGSKLRLCCIMALATVTSFCVCILFGAHPLRFWANFCWSYFVAGIVCTPAAHLIGTEVRDWTRVFVEHRFTGEGDWIAHCGSCGTVLGAWLGAFPILLDWNRPWQVWPIPCSVGALLGNSSSYLGAIIFILVRRNYYKTF